MASYNFSLRLNLAVVIAVVVVVTVATTSVSGLPTGPRDLSLARGNWLRNYKFRLMNVRDKSIAVVLGQLFGFKACGMFKQI